MTKLFHILKKMEVSLGQLYTEKGSLFYVIMSQLKKKITMEVSSIQGNTVILLSGHRSILSNQVKISLENQSVH